MDSKYEAEIRHHGRHPKDILSVDLQGVVRVSTRTFPNLGE